MFLTKEGDSYNPENRVPYVPADVFTVVGSMLTGVTGPLDVQNAKLLSLTGGRKLRKRSRQIKKSPKIQRSRKIQRKSQKRKSTSKQRK